MEDSSAPGVIPDRRTMIESTRRLVKTLSNRVLVFSSSSAYGLKQLHPMAFRSNGATCFRLLLTFF